MKKKALIGLIILSVLIIGIYLYNYYTINNPVQTELNSDPRNSGINISTHYENYVEPNTLILDLKGFSGDKSKTDIFRVLLQSAEALKGQKFEYVKLAYNGKNKFEFTGTYFKQLGDEYNYQNAMYTLRTITKNVLTLDGKKAYDPEYHSGLFGGLISGVDNFSDFCDKWYMTDYIRSHK